MKSIVFDFDFTLADSSPGVVECASYAFHRLGMPPRAEAEIRSTIGLSLEATLAHLQGPQPSEVSARFFALFMERADQVMVDRTRLYDVVPEVFRALRTHGHRIGIVSTKFRRRIEAVLASHRLDAEVDLIVGGDDVPRYKPDPAGLLLARRGLLGDAHPAIYVGDHPVDAAAASAARFTFIAVLTGVHRAESFSESKPAAILDTVADLPDALAAGVE